MGDDIKSDDNSDGGFTPVQSSPSNMSSSADSSSKNGGASGRSRRKPTKTHRHVGDSDGEGAEPEEGSGEAEGKVSNLVDEYLQDGIPEELLEGLGVNPRGATVSGGQGEGKAVGAGGGNEGGENPLLPEGTVVVEPEAVEERHKPVFQGPEFGSGKKSPSLVSINPALAGPIQCTACHGYIAATRRDVAHTHPVLKVLLCKKCYVVHTTKEIRAGEDGLDDSCRWCAEGGDLICCDFCHHAFCKLCVRRNMGRAALNAILNADEDDKWHCYVCDPTPISHFIDNCAQVITALQTLEPTPSVIPSRRGGGVGGGAKPLSVGRGGGQGGNHRMAGDGVTSGVQGEVGRGGGGTPRGRGGGRGSRGGGGPQYGGSTRDDLIYIRTASGGVVGIPPRNQEQACAAGKTSPAAAAINTNLGSFPPVCGGATGGRPRIDAHNVWTVLEKLLAATQSMGMLLGSLKDDLRRTTVVVVGGVVGMAGVEGGARKKREVATKLWRAFVAYKKSFQDIELFSRGSALGGAPKEEGGAAAPRGGQAKDVIELSDSGEEGEKEGEGARRANKKRAVKDESEGVPAEKRTKTGEGEEGVEVAEAQSQTGAEALNQASNGSGVAVNQAVSEKDIQGAEVADETGASSAGTEPPGAVKMEQEVLAASEMEETAAEENAAEGKDGIVGEADPFESLRFEPLFKFDVLKDEQAS